MKKRLEIAVLTLSSLLVATAQVASAASIKIVAQQNEESPEATYFFKKFERPAISDAAGERVAAFTRLAGKKCIFSFDPDNDPDSTVICRRDPTPDPLRFFGKLGDPTINLTSTVAWSARLTSGRSGVFRSGPATVALLGDPVPAPGTGLLKLLSAAHIVDGGDVIFLSTISGGAILAGVEVDQGIFRCSGGDGNCSAAAGGTGTLSNVALVNDAVSDRAGREFCKFFEIAASTFGVAFRASTQLDCADSNEVPAAGIFRGPVTGPWTTVALAGETSEPFPVPGGTTYARLSSAPALSNSGMVAFQGSTTGVLAITNVYLCNPATCPLLAPADEAVAQGDLDDANNAFRSFSGLGVSDVGDIAFSAKVTGAAGVVDGLYIRRTTDDIETIAIAGDPVPGSVPPAVFQRFLPPSVSGAGKLAFTARLERAATPRKISALLVYE